jgi:hypothetical protein
VALVLVLLGLSMLGAVALGLTMSSTVVRFTAANHDETIALSNAADSALELAARELAVLSLDEVLGGLQPSTLVDGAPGEREVSPGVTIDLQLLTHQLTCGRVVPCTDAQVQEATVARPWGANNPRWRPFIHQFLDPPGLPQPPPRVYIAVWVGDDAREDDGDSGADGAGAGQEGRYTVRARAEAFGPRGGRHAIEAELTRLCTDGPAGETCVPGSRVKSWRVASTFP